MRMQLLYIIAKALELAWEDDVKSQILIELTDRIVEFIKKQ